MAPQFSDSVFLSGIIEISPPWMRTSIFPAVSSLKHGWQEKVVRKLCCQEPNFIDSCGRRNLDQIDLFIKKRSCVWSEWEWKNSYSGKGDDPRLRETPLAGQVFSRSVCLKLDRNALIGLCAWTNPSADATPFGMKCSFWCWTTWEFPSLGFPLLSVRLGRRPCTWVLARIFGPFCAPLTP